MPDVFRSPRTIAEQVNAPSMFESAEAGQDPIAGVPTSVAGTRPMRDDGAHPVNPPAQPAPAANLKR